MGRGRSGQTTSPGESDFLGKRGKSISVFDSYSKANPHWLEGKEYQINCQRCVFAYEMRRRGYDVEALPNFEKDRLGYRDDPQGWPKVMENMPLIPVGGSGTVKETANTIAFQMFTYGVGARAIIRVGWKAGGGHVFMAEQTRNGTIFVDPQTGRRVDIYSYLNDAIVRETYLARTDDKKPTALLEKCVKKRGS